MNPRHRQLGLVLLSLVGSTLIWAGCAGMAEPLPSLAVAPASLTVSAKVGSASSLPVTITNTGQTPLSVTQAVLSGTGFSMSGLATPVTLPGGQSATFTVKFAAAQVGVVNGNVEFMTDSRHAPHMLPLHGTGSSQNPVVASIVVSPPVATPAPSAKVQFTAAIQGATTNDAVTWAASIGTISATGVFTAPSVGGIGTIVATSVADPTKSATATVAVAGATPPPSGSGVTGVTVTPRTASSVTSGTLQFKSSVVGTTSNTAVTWKALLGTITSAGSYTAPSKAGADTVTATSVADSTKSGFATVTVTAPGAAPVVTSISVSPNTASVSTGGTKQFSASVQGTVTDTSVTWTAALGTINSSGLYTAPAKAGTDTVTATSNAQSNKSASATVTVTASAPAPAPPSSNPSSSVTCSGSNCPAFPGAQGGGAAAAGGRGGVVMEVTNLNDSGTGSLRACIEASGPRTCVFRVSGMITFLSRAQISNPYITIAGQTAPGGGIVIGGPNQKGEQIFVSTHDVVVRYLTYDGNNPNTPTGPDTGTVCCEMASGDVYNVIWDHMTARWMGNKAFPLVSNSANNNIHNMNIQWSLVYEPNVAHAVGIGTVYVDQGGSGMATTDDDAHHNMFITVDHRLPLNQSGNHVRWVNNIVYNWGQFAALSMGGVQTDYIGNKYVDGNGCLTSAGCLNYSNTHVFTANGNNCDPTDETGDCPDEGGADDNKQAPSMYMLNNTGRTGATRGSAMVTPTTVANDSGQKSMTQQGSECGEGCDPNATGPWPSSWYRSSPLPAEQFPIVADPVTNLDSVLLPTVGNSQHLNCTGNWVSNRDTQDARIINVYQNNLADDLFIGQHSAPAIPAGTACTESLHDGIPDQWKSANGLSTTDTNLSSEVAPNGFTYLENYLNGTNPN